MPRGIVPSTIPDHKLWPIAVGDGKTHARHSPSLDAASHARSSPTRNSARRRLPRIVDLLTHHFFHFGAQLLHDAPDVVGDVTLGDARPRQRDGLVELHAPGPRRHQYHAIAQAHRLAYVV